MRGEQLNSKGRGGPREGYVYRGGGGAAIFGIFTTLIYFCEFPLLSIP